MFGLTDWPRRGEGCDKCGWKIFLSEMDVLEKQLFEINHKLIKKRTRHLKKETYK